MFVSVFALVRVRYLSFFCFERSSSTVDLREDGVAMRFVSKVC